MRRSHAVAAVGVIITLSPITAWWAIGDLSETRTNPDYLFNPPPLTPAQELLIGLGALAVSLAAALVFLVSARQGLVSKADLGVALPLLVAGVFSGFAWRVMTAGVIGANIGGGLLVFFTPGFLSVMLAWSALQWRARSRGRQLK